MFPKWFVGLILGTINPLTIGIDAENHGFIRFVVNLEKMNNLISNNLSMMYESDSETSDKSL